MSVHVSIEVDEPAHAGEELSAVVVVESDGPREIDGVTLSLQGAATVWRRGQVEQWTGLDLEERLAEATRLEGGPQRFAASFALPEDLIPSCATDDLTVRYTLHARVAIPWWFSATASRDVAVAPATPDEERPAPQRKTASRQLPGAEGLFLEVTLDDDTWAPGETLTGAFSLGNVEGHPLDGASVTIIAPDAATCTALPSEQPVFKSLVGVGEGRVIPFAIPIPRGAPPSMRGERVSIGRVVLVSIDGMSLTCSVPIAITAHEPRTGGKKRDADAIGASRWREAWRAEGERFGLSLGRAGLSLSGHLGGGAVATDVHAEGAELAAELRWESLGVGLTVERRGLLALGGVRLTGRSRAFDVHLLGRGRDDAQVRAALDPDLCSALVAFDGLHLDDEGARVSRAAQARDAAALRAFLESLAVLAEVAAALPRRLPPPEWAQGAPAVAWQAFATSTAGRFDPGPVRVVAASLDGERVDVKTVPGDEGPAATEITLTLDPPVEIDDEPAAPEAVIAAARALGPGAPRFTLTAETMSVTVPHPTPDPAALRPLLAEMARHAARLRGGARGPYR